MRRGLPYFLFGLVTLIVFWSFLARGHSLYSVSQIETILGRREAAPPALFPRHARVVDNVLLLPSNLRIYNEGLKAGELRLWNPYLFCGYPIYADPMVHPFYPPQIILHALLPPIPAYEVSLMLHLFFSGVTMLWAMRALKMSEAAGTIAGLAWMLFGYNAMWFSTGILLGVSVFFPLALMWTVQGLERRDLSRAPRAALALGMVVLGSHPQHALHFFLFLAAWIAVVALRNRENRRFALSFGVLVAVLSVGVAAVELLARLDTITYGYRKSGSDMRVLYANPWALLGEVVGLAIGKIQFHSIGPVDFEFTVYAGVVILTLAVVGAAREFKEPAIRFSAIFAGAAFLVAFIRPLAEILQLIPVLRLSPPSRWLCVFGFCLALLAGRGLDSLSSGLGRIPEILAAGAGLFVLACLAKMGPMTFSNPAVKVTMVGILLALASAFLARRDPQRGLRLAIVAIVLDHSLLFLAFNSHSDPSVLGKVPEVVSVVRDRQTDPWRATGQFGAPASKGQPPSLGDRLAATTNNALAIHGVETVGGFEAIIPAHTMRYFQQAGATHAEAGRTLAIRDFSSPLLDGAGLKYVILHKDISAGDRFTVIQEFGSVKVYENSEVLPRAYMVSSGLRARDEDEAADLIKSPSFRPRDSVVLQTVEELQSAPAGPIACEIRWVERSSDRVLLEVTAAQRGFLVLSDADYPGWVATVDGQRTPILRANVAFRALKLTEGKHQVEFRFSPGSVRWGMAGSLLSMALAIAWIVRQRSGSRSAAPPQAG